MKQLMVKADDLGISEAVTYGILSAHENGIVTMTGAMINMPFSQKAADLSKKYDNLSIGLHVNLVLGDPISNLKEIPGLVDKNGRFVSSKQRRKEIANGEDNFNHDELIIEISNQVKRFQEIFGYLPEYIEGHAVMTKKIMKAIIVVAKKFDIKNLTYVKGKISFPMFDAYSYFEENEDFSNLFIEDKYDVLKNDISLLTFHPGFLDYSIMVDSSLTIGRIKDHEVLTSTKTKNWVKNNNIKLVNFRDVPSHDHASLEIETVFS